ENSRFAEMLFGMTEDGILVAFNALGELQPIFTGGSTSVNTGLFDVRGLAFSTLDENLWHVTGQRGNDAGHGINPTFDGSRVLPQSGGSRFHFGVTTNNLANRNYNFPGGAHGSIVTDMFSLEGYEAADLPVLYFNYYLETEDVDYNPVPFI